jgi:GT2 family glycosyltransferase
VIAYVVPTRNRTECLARTLGALGSLARHAAEVIVVDNAGTPAASVGRELANGLPVTLLRRARNEGAAGRNAGVRAADGACEWVVMLDDDSHPLDAGFVNALREQPTDVAAVCAEIFLPDGRREAGGLPEVPIGCGVAYRRKVFESMRIGEDAGYDSRFGFYAEEYDLAARLIRAGHRIVMDRRFVVQHEKTSAGRSMDAILRRLVRNNAWVMARYAPAAVRGAEIRRVISRYGRIAVKEGATFGYAAGVAELAWTLPGQARREPGAREWERFTGKTACRQGLLRAWAARRFDSAAIVAHGKNDHIVRGCLCEMGVRVIDDARSADAVVIGTLSPGPMLDAAEALGADGRLVVPWVIPMAPGATREAHRLAA